MTGRHSLFALWNALADANDFTFPPGGLKSRLYRQLRRALLGKGSKGSLYHAAACILHLWGLQTLSGMCFRKALTHFSRSKDPNLLADCHRDYGLTLERQRYVGDARDQWEEAYRLYLQSGNHEGQASSKKLLDNLNLDNSSSETSIPSASLQSMREDVYHLQLEELHKLHLILKPHEDPRLLLDSILRALLHTTNATRAALILEQEDSRNRFIAMDFRENHLAETEMPIDRELVDKARAGKSIESLNSPGGNKGQSVICAPLWREKYWGCIYLENQNAPQLFNQSALKAVQILSTQTLLLLDYSERMQEVQALNRGLTDQAAHQAETILSKNKTLRQTRTKLKRIQNLKSLLTETIVHDVKNYQAIIASNLRIAKKSSTLPHNDLETWQQSMDTCSQVQSLSSNLMDLSKIDANPHSLNKVYLSRETLAAAIAQAEAQDSHSVSWKFGDGVPSHFEIQWDTYYFKRMWTTLAEWLRVKPSQSGQVHITINFLPQFLEGFEPQPSELQLVFCRQIVEAHGGRLSVDGDGHLVLALNNRYGLIINNRVGVHV